MGHKSRGNFPVNICLKECDNRALECYNCFKFSKYKEMKNDSKKRRVKEVKTNPMYCL
jgi:hypothetical protein